MAARKPVATRPARRVPFIHFDFGRKAPAAKPKARELMPNFVILLLVLISAAVGIELADSYAIAQAQAALDQINLTPAETAARAKALQQAIEADTGNDEIIKLIIVALAGVVPALAKRNGDK